jgi:hypothetical protein
MFISRAERTAAATVMVAAADVESFKSILVC